MQIEYHLVRHHFVLKPNTPENTTDRVLSMLTRDFKACMLKHHPYRIYNDLFSTFKPFIEIKAYRLNDTLVWACNTEPDRINITSYSDLYKCMLLDFRTLIGKGIGDFYFLQEEPDIIEVNTYNYKGLDI